MKKILKIATVLAVGIGLSYAVYDLVRERETYEIKLWNNIYNGDNIEFFYEDESDLRIEMLKATYNLTDTVVKDNEIESVLAMIDRAKEIVSVEEVNDTKALNGYDIIRIIGEKRVVSQKDMAIILRDFTAAMGYKVRVGEFRANKKEAEKYERYHVLECYSTEYNKWVVIDFMDRGYFIYESEPCSGVELIDKNTKELQYIGDSTDQDYFKSNKELFKSYTIMIDNTVERIKSNSYLTYITSKNQVSFTYGDEILMPTIYSENISLFTKSPDDLEVKEDEGAYIIMMKSEEEDVERFVVGGFKDGKILDQYYIGRNDGSFELVKEYFEVELIKGENMISISLDGVNEEARIEVIYN